MSVKKNQLDLSSINNNVVVAKCQVNNTLGSFVNILYDSSSSYKWLDKCKFVKAIKKISETSGYFIFIYEAPVGKNQCLITYASLKQTQKGQPVIFKLKNQHDLPKDVLELSKKYEDEYNAVKAEDFDITWEFTKKGDTVNVKLESYIKPDLNNVVRMFADIFFLPNYMEKIAKKTVKNICEESKKKKYQYTKSALISE